MIPALLVGTQMYKTNNNNNKRKQKEKTNETSAEADTLPVNAAALVEQQPLSTASSDEEISMEMEEQLLADPPRSPRKSKSGKKVSPGQIRRRLFRRATHVKMILDAKDPSSLSEKEKNSLAWAIDTIAKDALTRPIPKQSVAEPSVIRKADAPKASHSEKRGSTKDNGKSSNRVVAAKAGPTVGKPIISRAAERRRRMAETKREDLVSKRLRSSEDTKNPPKRPKVDTEKAYSGVIRSSLQLAVVDFGKPGGQYSPERGQMIEKALARAVFDRIRRNAGTTAPTFGRAKWQRGFTMIDCKDQLSFEFAKATVRGLKLWEGAALQAVPPEKIPTTPKGRLCVPDWGVNKEEILDFLKAQNPSIDMKSWEVVGEEEVRGGTKGFIILIFEPPALLLENKQLRLCYGAGEATLKLIKRTQPAETDGATDAMEVVIASTNEGSANQPPPQ